MSRLGHDLVQSRFGDDYMEPIKLRNHLGNAIKADFESGRIVVLDGWVVSRTEARIAALAALG
jgi:hypothetical protein